MPTRGKQNKTTEEEFTFEAIVKQFTEAFQRHITLNLEHRNLLISILDGILYIIYKQIEDNIVPWVGQFLDIIQVATQFSEELKTTVLAFPLQYSCLENPMDGGAWWAAVHGVAKSPTQLSDFTFTHWRRKWQPTPVFLLGESQGWGSLVGCRLWGRTELDTTEVT